MLGPLEFAVTPSCTDCLSWSDDGELALAAGEYVHILTPKISSEASAESSVGWKYGTDHWHAVKFRANVFPDEDWPIGFPRPVRNFSIGAEQSISSVVALKWSPPGLAKYNRCILAVLTANLILSIWEPLGNTAKWTRVSLVNHAVQNYFRPLVEDEELRRQKQMIRSFTWSPTGNIAGSDGNISRQGANGSWPEIGGSHFLATANDDNDIIFLQVKKDQRDPAKPKCLLVDGLTHVSLEPRVTQNPNMQGNSLLARSFKSKRWMTHVCWGPWIYETPNEDSESKATRSVIAVTQSSTVRFVHLNASPHQKHEVGIQEAAQQCPFCCYEERQALEHAKLEGTEITGPLHWSFTKDYSSISLVVAALGCLITVEFPNASYGRTGHESSSQNPDVSRIISSKQLLGNTPFTGTETDGERAHPWDSITGMASTFDRGGTTCILHVATLFSYAQSLRIPMLPRAGDVENGIRPAHETPYWYSQIAEFRDRFDLDNDLGGYAAARVWGVATHRGWVAACFSLHPTDMVEYITAMEERITVIFSPAERLGPTDSETALPWAVPSPVADQVGPSYGRVLHFILGLEYGEHFQKVWERKILYAAACCAIVTHLGDELLSLSKRALLYLTNETGADLAEEISKCEAASAEREGNEPILTISPKPSAQTSGPRSELFEVCDICGSGIEWYSFEEAQCSAGHQFVRCGLTFLSIQDPDGSKFCSLCGAEYLEEEHLAETSPHSSEGGDIHHIIFNTFDTCIYCGGKFRS